MRLYHEARNDKKLATLTDKQFRVWFNLLCLAGEQKTRGIIRYDDPYLLAIEVSRGDVALLERTLELLAKLRIVNVGDEIAFVNFDKRQYDKPSDTPERVTERVRKHRERQRNADETPGNTTEQNRAEESREDVPPTPSEGDEPTKPQRSIKTPCPEFDQFSVPDDVFESIAKEQDLTEADLIAETAKMVDHYRSKGERRVDWVATWRNWMRSDFRKPRGSPPTQRNGRSNGLPSALDFAAKAIELERQGL